MNSPRIHLSDTFRWHMGRNFIFHNSEFLIFMQRPGTSVFLWLVCQLHLRFSLVIYFHNSGHNIRSKTPGNSSRSRRS